MAESLVVQPAASTFAKEVAAELEPFLAGLLRNALETLKLDVRPIVEKPPPTQTCKPFEAFSKTTSLNSNVCGLETTIQPPSEQCDVHEPTFSDCSMSENEGLTDFSTRENMSASSDTRPLPQKTPAAGKLGLPRVNSAGSTRVSVLRSHNGRRRSDSHLLKYYSRASTLSNTSYEPRDTNPVSVCSVKQLAAELDAKLLDEVELSARAPSKSHQIVTPAVVQREVGSPCNDSEEQYSAVVPPPTIPGFVNRCKHERRTSQSSGMERFHRRSLSSRMLSLEDLEKLNVCELSQQADQIIDDSHSCHFVENRMTRLCFIPYLQFCGIQPWDSGSEDRPLLRPSIAYQWGVLALVCFSAAACLWQASIVQAEVWAAPACSGCAWSSQVEVGLLSDVPLAVGAVLGLLSLRTAWGSRPLCDCNQVLLRYIHREGFLAQWKQRQVTDLVANAVVWLVAISLRFVSVANTERNFDVDGAGLISFCAFAILSAVLSGLMFCCLYVCDALAGIVDLFGHTVAKHTEHSSSIHEWNVLQAVLRKASGTIECNVFVMQATAVSAVLLIWIDLLRGGRSVFSCISCILVVLNVARVFFRAAAVTDKCLRMPSLVSSLWSSQDMDLKRYYLVQYIDSSVAGFYVFETRVTSGIVLKFVYLCCVLGFALVTRFV